MKLLLVALLFFLLAPCACYAGPFGLDAGMSRDQVVQVIGKNAIVKDTKNSIFFKTVPVPNAYFAEYQCSFDKNNRLESVRASSEILTTQPSGEDLRYPFDRLESALADKYGKPLYISGGTNSGPKWPDLRAYDTFIDAAWDGSSGDGKLSHIATIHLQIMAIDKDRGFIELVYRFSASTGL